jgi:hypothetical protein
MAQTKKASSRRSNSSKSNRSSSSSRSAKSSKSSNGASRAKAKSSSGSSRAKSQTKSAVKNGAHGAAEVVRKAKVPLVASGAAAAGIAGAVVMSRTGRRRKVLGVPVPKGDDLRGDARKIAGAVTDAAKQADAFGQRVSRVANSVQKVGETADHAAKKA